jgi:hypothetical protein
MQVRSARAKFIALALLATSVVFLEGAAPPPGPPSTHTPIPTIVPSNGKPSTSPYACPNTVTMADINKSAIIWYSTTGNPVAGAAGTYQYTGPLQVNQSETVTVMAIAPGLLQSQYVQATFACPVVSGPPWLLACAPGTLPPPPTFNPSTVLENSGAPCPTNVTVHAAAGSTIYLTTNGQSPSPAGPAYTGAPFSVTPGETLKAIACYKKPVPDATCCSAAATVIYACAPPPSYDTIQFVIQTGDDGADAGLEIDAAFAGNSFCLKQSNQSSLPALAPCQGSNPNAPAWVNGQGVVICSDTGGTTAGTPQCHGPVALMSPLPGTSAVPAVQISIRQTSCSLSCNNWDIQGIKVTISNSKGSLPPITRTYGSIISTSWTSSNCIARLKAPPNATTISFTITGTPSMTYFDGTASEQGEATSCANNGG